MLHITDLYKTYTSKDGGEVTALGGVSIDFDPHQTTAIVGPSGSGKSTLLRTLNLLEIPERGTLSVTDRTIDFSNRITSDDKHLIRAHSAMVFQDFQLFAHVSVLDNVTLGPIQALGIARTEAVARARELLANVGLAGREDAYPYQLSGGQKQRVAIARALAMQPEYLLCDEPTSALDPELAAEVRTTLQDVARQQTALILVTHDMGFARSIADRIIFLQDGKIEFDGDTQAFFAAPTERIERFLDLFA
ncbi:amino acid ABC transporter ATP-binding protein [Arcanobacterium pinnipediorum]|uniref:Amino acid ABC transporter ATP-binding protein n=1 Tax=Arcanobacterium pinnipediorum TaxID=1503041 RepID=A0ABY5AFE5_9ACTO|nr:amino acid ABC transporter ATP-binding protein [Arcanobacterium pinnipediorum]USR78905.1 amino acid ABC transporter ATP-binding protein [Arcanobacterium pinnipediorum]